MAALGACGILDAAVVFGETHPAEWSKAVGRRNSLLAPRDAQDCPSSLAPPLPGLPIANIPAHAALWPAHKIPDSLSPVQSDGVFGSQVQL